MILMQRNHSSWSDGAPDEREPDGEDRLGQARRVRVRVRDDDDDDDDDDDGDDDEAVERGVPHRPSPLPLREEEEEELSEADRLDELVELDDDDALAKPDLPRA